MTISATTNRVTYTGNGSTTAFAFAYPFHNQADLVVIETVIATGAQTTKALTTDYVITGTTDAQGHYSSGGTVTALTAPASTVTWTIYRDPSPVQETDLVQNDDLPAESLESALDHQTLLNLRTRDLIDRSLRQPEGDSADIDYLPTKVDRASKYLAFDADGDPVATAGTTSAIVVSSFIETLLDDANAATARATIGAVGLTGDETVDGDKIFSGAASSRTNSVATPITITSVTSGTPAAGIGTGVLFKAESADENPSDVGQIQAVFSDVSAGSEDSYWELLIRRAGATLAAAYRFVSTGTARAIFTHANSADRTYTLPNSSLTLVGQGATITSGTAAATTSGATVDFTGIPSWVTRVTIMFSGVSVSGTDNLLIRLGDAGGLEDTNYLGSYGWWDTVTNTGSLSSGFLIISNSAASVFHGRATFSLLDAATNTWAGVGTFAKSNSALVATFAGSKALSAPLDRISVVLSGANAFDAGLINISYE